MSVYRIQLPWEDYNMIAPVAGAIEHADGTVGVPVTTALLERLRGVPHKSKAVAKTIKAIEEAEL